MLHLRHILVFTAMLACGSSSSAPSMSGSVSLERVGGSQTYAVAAIFWQGTPTEGEDVTTIGPCTLIVAKPDGGVLPIPAGTVSFAGTPSGTSVQLTTAPNAPSVPFNDLDTVTVTATGQIFPAFSGSIQLPTRISVSSPNISQAFPVDRASDLVISHSTDASGQFFVEFHQTTGGYSDLLCRFPGTDQTATVPASALSHLSPTAPTSALDTFMGTIVDSDTQAGSGAVVHFSARNDVQTWANVQ